MNNSVKRNHELTVRMIDAKDHWQKRAVLLLYDKLGLDITELATAWSDDAKWIQDQIKTRQLGLANPKG